MSIVLRDLTKTYQGLAVVSRVNLEVQDGELFVLLGGSGSGKSTILRLIAGLARPDGGQILVRGKDVTHLAPQSRDTGFVFQNYSLFRTMTVAENIEFGLRVRKVPLAERKRRSEELMDLIDLVGLGDRYPDELSGGQQQRVALARALAYEPSVLLLDEPFGALDVKIRGQLRRSLREIQQKLKVTAILVTHDQEEGFELADRIGLVERGHLVEVGTPEQLYHRPNSQFAATFVGGGNVLVGSIEDGQICLASQRLPMPESAPQHLGGAQVRLLVRPESVDLTGKGTPLASGVVVESVFAGSQQRVRVEVEALRGVRCLAPTLAYGQGLPHLQAVVPSTPDSQQYRVGQTVSLGLLHYHVLERTGFRSLVFYERTPAGALGAEFGCRVALATGAPATLLAVAGNPKEEKTLGSEIDAIKGRWSQRLHNLKTMVRRGPIPEEILREMREGLHEMIVLGEEDGPPTLRLTAWVSKLLQQAEVPLLLVQKERQELKRILICTAGGEPGKGDVWMGARLAKRAGAEATVATVIPKDGANRERVQSHLDRAVASLEGMGIATGKVLLEGDVVPLLLGEAERGDYDLIVVGSSGRADMASKLIRGTQRPMLVVPLLL